MTRDEAIAIFRTHMSFATDRDVDIQTRLDEAAVQSVNAFSALGMLKIDEPKSADKKFRDAMAKLGYGKNSCVWPDLARVFADASLKIVEK